MKKYNYIHLASFSPDRIFNSMDEKYATFLINGKEYRVKMRSARYYVFARSRFCACCGLEGTVMMLDTCPNQEESAHFNLYGYYNEEEVLFTKDHIVPKSKGGHNGADNLQTMCSECNARKSDYITTENLIKSQYMIKRRDIVEKERRK